jgi:pyridoxal phosphate enzyme (YggS family)
MHIAQNIELIRERMARAAILSGRLPDEVALVAISKTFPQESISEAVAAGLTKFGENRVQEAENKIPFFAGVPGLEWHLVGHLQSNKARRAVELFDVIHSVDSFKLAERLNKVCLELEKKISVLIQVDLGGEETKFGADPSQIQELAGSISRLPGLCLNGLMTIPPFFEDPDQARPFFAQLRALRDSLEAEQPGCLGRRHLSMGMSHDFEAAIREGATIVRIGTAIFGLRRYL